ncbi:protein TAF14 [Kluyveromyces marxianus]|uniref:Protein TAF14 n=1 Tax=Kluyveromyces marxianus TaxID=4911 RepID=A0ABX6ERP8_KLUMA|nr:protein TAF14 [Kluyveromyces marxianus]
MKIVAKLKFSTTTYTFRHGLSFDENAYNVDFEGRFPFNNPKVRNELLRFGDVPDEDKDEINPIFITNLQKVIHLITLSNVETIQSIINSIVTFPPVSAEITKHFHNDDEFVILLSQLPTNLIEKICNMVEASSNDILQ